MFETFAYRSLAFYKDFSGFTAEKLQALGLNYGALFFVLYVGKHPGCTVSELTKALQADWGHSQRSVTKLVESGFLTKERAGRAFKLNLTPKGREAFAVSHSVFAEWDEKALVGLTEAERGTLFAILRKMEGRNLHDGTAADTGRKKEEGM